MVPSQAGGCKLLRQPANFALDFLLKSQKLATQNYTLLTEIPPNLMNSPSFSEPEYGRECAFPMRNSVRGPGGFKTATIFPVIVRYILNLVLAFAAPLVVFASEHHFKFPPNSISPEKPFVLGVDADEGNYDVVVTLGDRAAAGSTTIKAESRRLMIEKVDTKPGEFVTCRFTVNVRKAAIGSSENVLLNQRELGPPVVPDWDDQLTLEFNGKRPAVASLDITPAKDPITIYIAGDSTVTDQANEPWAGWGQMLPCFFQPGVAVANHAESGLALYSFERQKRLEKVLSTMKRGDYLFIQFGHNDQKDRSPGAGPFTSYKKNLTHYAEAVRAKGGNPVLITPMERRRWSGAQPQSTLADYAEAVRQVASEQKTPVIDLNAMSLKLYAALGPDGSTKAFVHYPANSFPGQTKALKDDTHHNDYGAYELAKCVVEGIKSNVPALAIHLRPNLAAYDPTHPDKSEEVGIPPSPASSVTKPAGN